MAQEPKILNKSEIPSSEAKWLNLRKISWVDQDGKERVWECADRRTRGKGGIDAVAIAALLKYPKDSGKPASTVIIEQYRPPVGKVLVEFPAGLIDAGESPSETAIRELREETGYKGQNVRVLEEGFTMFSDPGMSSANLKTVIVEVPLEADAPEPVPELDAGEHIVTRVVPLNGLYDILKDYDSKGFAIDARLANFALGWRMAREA